MNSKQFLGQVMKEHDLHSQYALAKKLGMSQSRVSMYMRGRREFDEETCLQVSKLLNEGPMYVEFMVASVQAERAKTPAARKVWVALAGMVKKQRAAALRVLPLLLITSLLNPLAGNPLSAQELARDGAVYQSIHYTHKANSRRRGGRRKRCLRALRRRTVRWVTLFRRHRRYCSFGATDGAQGAQLLHGS